MMQQQSPQRIQFRISPSKGNLNYSPPPVQRVVISPSKERLSPSPSSGQRVVIVEKPHVVMTPIRRSQVFVNKHQIAETIYTKLEHINSKLYKMTEIELQNQALKEQNEKLRGVGPRYDIKQDIEQSQHEQSSVDIQRSKQIKRLEEENDDLRFKLKKYVEKFALGRQIFIRILEDETMKDKAEITEMRQIFDD